MVAAAPSAITHPLRRPPGPKGHFLLRSEEHTSELQSRLHLVCRLLLEKKKNSCVVETPVSFVLPHTQNGELAMMVTRVLLEGLNALEFALERTIFATANALKRHHLAS